MTRQAETCPATRGETRYGLVVVLECRYSVPERSAAFAGFGVPRVTLASESDGRRKIASPQRCARQTNQRQDRYPSQDQKRGIADRL